MTVHLIKLCVGIDDVDHLAEVQKSRLAAKRRAGEPAQLVHVTRSFPRQAESILDGGSMYWVIKGVIRVRQRIVALHETVNSKGKPACGIALDPVHVQTERRPFRPFQGWRYLKPEDAPRDLSEVGEDAAALPEELSAELKELGLI